MTARSDDARWRQLEADAHRPEGQALIRREIRAGTIRVVPAPGGGIRIVPRGQGDWPGPAVGTLFTPSSVRA